MSSQFRRNRHGEFTGWLTGSLPSMRIAYPALLSAKPMRSNMIRLPACLLALALVLPASAALWLEAADAAPPKASTATKNAKNPSAATPQPAPAAPTIGIETEARAAYLGDFRTRAVL